MSREDQTHSGPSQAVVNDVADWLMDASLASMPGDELLALLNENFGCTVGEVLDAAAEAKHGLKALNDRRRKDGKEPIDLWINRYVGDLMFGNIGVANRVEFAVAGGEAMGIHAPTDGLGAHRTAAA